MADISITAANVAKSSGQVEDVTYGDAAITAGMALYRKASDGKWYKAQKDGSAEESGYGTKIGIALNGGGANQPGRVQLNGVITAGATLTEGIAYYVSSTAGGICPVADVASTNYVTVLGVAQDASLLVLNPIASGGQLT